MNDFFFPLALIITECMRYKRSFCVYMFIEWVQVVEYITLLKTVSKLNYIYPTQQHSTVSVYKKKKKQNKKKNLFQRLELV